jgi:hypothetical protein
MVDRYSAGSALLPGGSWYDWRGSATEVLCPAASESRWTSTSICVRPIAGIRERPLLGHLYHAGKRFWAGYQGKDAFSEFRIKGSEWFHGDTYLFIYDQKGNVLLNPAFPTREGTNISGQKDTNGKPFQDALILTAATKGSGWVDYMFLRPGQTQPSHKWTYVRAVKINGVPGLVGSGFYSE